MPIMVPKHGVTVQRKDEEGNLVNLHPPIGKPFNFTDAEVRVLSNSGIPGGTLKDPPRGEPVVTAEELTADPLATDPVPHNPADPPNPPAAKSRPNPRKQAASAAAADDDDGL